MINRLIYFVNLLGLLLWTSLSYGQDIKITPDMYKYSENSITGVYLCTPSHVLSGDCKDVDDEYYDNLARISLGSYEIGLLFVNGQKTVALKGPLSPGVSQNLIRILNEYDDVSTLVLSSQGGSEEEAYKIADYIKEKKMNTWVPTRRMCLSACVPIFLSGELKTLDGQLGLHTGKFYISDPYQVRNLEAARETIKEALYQNDLYTIKRVRMFLDLNIPLSLIDAMIAARGKYLVFTSINQLLEFDPSLDYIRTLEEMSEFSRSQPAYNFNFQSYKQLF